MPKWTSEQLLAIEKDGSNIIVSAGAGSGKTAVLSERVLYKLKKGVHITELLILTFTRAAAEEMKDRIRRKIKDNEELKNEADAIDSAYITTFDSFALSVVKKYHYLLNIPHDIGITDDTIVQIEKKKILDSVFEDFYKNNDEDFLDFIHKYCIKNDSPLRNSVRLLADRLENFIDKDGFLDSLIDTFYSEEHLNSIINEYKGYITEQKKCVQMELENTSYYFDNDYIVKLEALILPLLNTESLDEFVKYKSIKLPPVPRGSDEDAKNKKNKLKEAVDNLLKLVEFGSEEDIKESILGTKKVTSTIVKIIKEYFKRLGSYKEENGIYTFQDIAFLAIKIVRDFATAREELKNSFKEIMIDEYQDTNDIQETFIRMIRNDNVYMVGDIKQSIYRFRGSNPIIFKDKYDNYSKNNGGYKIDLIKNFRSRSEVLNNINVMFDLLMDNALGGAEYYESHEMVFGNTSYNDEKLDGFDYNMRILEYPSDETKEYSDNEIEIFAIAKDIKEKMDAKMLVFDKETSKLRPITYSDFVIILDRSKFFDDYKRIFEYLDIPLTILKDGKLNASEDILLIRNIVDIIIRIKNGDFGREFKFDYLSIGRSFLYEFTDEYLFEIITENCFKDTKIYEDFKSIDGYNSKTCSELFEEILDITEFYQKLNKIGDYENINVRMSTISDMAKNLETLGYTVLKFRDYLDEIIENNYDIKYTEYSSGSDSVKILTIHKSKGLEYPICYFADLDHDFNISDLKNRFICDTKYGLIAPTDSEDEKDSVVKLLYKNEYLKEEISEKIRLFYVALTRAREQMIILLPNREVDKLEKNENGTIELIRRLNFKRLSHFIYAIKPYMNSYFNHINLQDLNLTKNYLYNKVNKNKLEQNMSNEIIVEEVKIENEITENKHFSKSIPELITKSERNKMAFGTLFHEALEYTDFKNVGVLNIQDEFIKEKIITLINSDLLKNVSNALVYHEYEFYYEKNNTNYHGIIDLMLEYSDHIDIVDYKLKDTSDIHYKDQLKGYRDYIESITNKKVNTYLYSIIDGTIKEI